LQIFLGFELLLLVDHTKSTQHLVGRAKKAQVFFIKRKFLKNRNQNDKTKRNGNYFSVFFQNKSNSWLFFKKKKILLHFLLSRGK